MTLQGTFPSSSWQAPTAPILLFSSQDANSIPTMEYSLSVSPCFRDMFSTDFQGLSMIEGKKAGRLHHDWIRTDLELHSWNKNGNRAEHWPSRCLKRLCSKIGKAINCNPETALRILQIAKRCECKDLREAAIDQISLRFDQVWQGCCGEKERESQRSNLWRRPSLFQWRLLYVKKKKNIVTPILVTCLQCVNPSRTSKIIVMHAGRFGFGWYGQYSFAKFEMSVTGDVYYCVTMKDVALRSSKIKLKPMLLPVLIMMVLSMKALWTPPPPHDTSQDVSGFTFMWSKLAKRTRKALEWRKGLMMKTNANGWMYEASNQVYSNLFNSVSFLTASWPIERLRRDEIPWL